MSRTRGTHDRAWWRTPLADILAGFGLVTAVAVGALPVAAEPAPTLVLPLRGIGVSDTTVAVVTDLLRGELESRGVELVPRTRLGDVELPQDGAACDDADCANAAAASVGAARVVYGSLSRLGDKIIVRVRMLWRGDTLPVYADQLTALFEEDLDVVVRRVAESIAAGRPNAEQPTIATVTAEETLEPRRRASRSRFGLRAGFLFPPDDSYGGADRLTSLGLVIIYETPTFLIKSTPLLGIAWRGDTVEWTPFDLFCARIFGVGDFSPYLGAGLGIGVLNVENVVPVYFPGDPYSYGGGSQTETSLTADIGAGILAFRTYDFLIDLDLRYHYVFADFNAVGGKGAHGVALRFGIAR